MSNETLEDVPFVAIDNQGRIMTPEWRHQICESCWFSNPANYEERGESLRIRFPVSVKAAHPQELFCYCCFCTKPTVGGIFIMKDPASMVCFTRETHGYVGMPDPGEED